MLIEQKIPAACSTSLVRNLTCLSVPVICLLFSAVLLIPAAAMGQTSAYAEECITNIDNATVHVPAEAGPSLPDGTPVEPGDTLAVYTEAGTCAGYGVWTEAGGTTLAAAGSDSISVSPDGYAAGDSLRFEVFDRSVGKTVDIGPAVAFTLCENVEVPSCGEGTYEDGTFHEVDDFPTNSSTSVTRTLGLAEGWNLISMPVQSDLPFGNLLPTCSSGFFYVPGDGYTEIGDDEPLPVGKGALVQCGADTTSVTGPPAPSDIEVAAGLNLIGSTADTVAASAVTSTPSGIVESGFYKGPPSEYQSASELRPGEGYWVSVAEVGMLHVSGSSSAPLRNGSLAASPGPAGAREDASRLLFVDARGRQVTLWIREDLTQNQGARFEVPPAPPGEMFDVRFANGRRAAPLASGEEADSSAQKRRVDLQGAAFPVEVRLETEDANQRFEISTGGRERTLSTERSSVQIQRPTGQLTVATVQSPREFRLGTVSPNPVQQQANLKYALPEQNGVTIAVYDALGREVARLVDGKRPTGHHQAQVDVRGLASGKYFVRMQAGPFRKVRPMTVVR